MPILNQVAVRTNDLFERSGTWSSVVIRQVLVRQYVHTNGLVQALCSVMYVNL